MQAVVVDLANVLLLSFVDMIMVLDEKILNDVISLMHFSLINQFPCFANSCVDLLGLKDVLGDSFAIGDDLLGGTHEWCSAGCFDSLEGLFHGG